jgi:arylsulfatase A-like enzyme
MSQPNIILLVLDAVRAQNLPCYGYADGNTPFLDQFAADNLLFKRAFAPATWTVPTHASMLSGLYLSQHRLENVKADRSFNEAIVTLPQALRAKNYKTAAFSQNFLFSTAHHLTEEFDEFFPLWSSERQQRKANRNRQPANRSGRYWNAIQRYSVKKASLRPAFDSFHHWLTGSEHDAPVFLMANVTSAHYPWAPPLDILWRQLGADVRYLADPEMTTPNPFRFNSGKVKVSDRHRRIWRALYDAAIIHTDRELGRFLDHLKSWPGWSNTILIVTADHGEMLGDYGNIFGHTLTLHDQLLHVPLLIRHPDYLSGSSVEGVVQTLDLYHTILDWSDSLGDDVPAAQLQRPSLTEALASPWDPSGLAFAEEDYSDSYNPIAGLRKVNPKLPPDKYPRIQRAVRSATHKYIWRADQPGEFYDLTSDPAEADNLIDTNVKEEIDLLLDLQQALSAWRDDMELFPPQVEAHAAELAPEMIEHLRALGYVA